MNEFSGYQVHLNLKKVMTEVEKKWLFTKKPEIKLSEYHSSKSLGHDSLIKTFIKV